MSRIEPPQEAIVYQPKILRSLQEICDEMGVGTKTVRSWVRDGAPIAVEWDTGNARYSAEAVRLQSWRRERKKKSGRPRHFPVCPECGQTTLFCVGNHRQGHIEQSWFACAHCGARLRYIWSQRRWVRVRMLEDVNSYLCA